MATNHVVALNVFLVRHGERKDEAEDWLPNTLKDQIDPPLTRKGYEQSQQSFSALCSAMVGSSFKAANSGAKQRIAVFCSPLRRTVGTAMMLADSLPLHHKFEWAPLLSSTTPINTDATATTETVPSSKAHLQCRSAAIVVPVVVLNGLCDCAAAIKHMGGSSIAVRQRLIDCAAMSQNDGNVHSPFMKAVSYMRHQGRGLGNLKSSAAVQFCRISDKGGGNSQSNLLVPVSPPISLRSDCSEKTFAAKPESFTASKMVVSDQNDIHSSLDFCVRLASEWGCKACIIVTHREAIRDVAKHNCGYHAPHDSQSRLSTPYCCIANFVATVERKRVQWTFHGILPYHKFDAMRIPLVVVPRVFDFSPEDLTTIQLSVTGMPSLSLCTINCRPIENANCKLGAFIIVTSLEVEGADSQPIESWRLRFRICEGARQVGDFFRMLREKRCVALGNVSWKDPDAQDVLVSVKIQWSVQAEIPCPPAWIGINLSSAPFEGPAT